MKRVISDKSFYVFLAVYLAASLLGMYFTPLFDEDEGFFAECARNMLETGNYIQTQVNGELRFDKPPLFAWLECLSILVFGLTEFAVRLPSFLFFLLFAAYVYYFVKSSYSKNQARWAVIVLLTLLQFQVLSKATVTDNLLNAFMAIALLAYLKFDEKFSQKHLYVFYLACGLGFLTKGPLAFALPAAVILLYQLSFGTPKKLWKLWNWKALLLCLLVPVPWFVLAYEKTGWYFIQDLFLKHNIGRFSSTMEGHGGHWWYYIPVLFLAFIPFTQNLKVLFKTSWQSREERFLFIWFTVTFVLFSISNTQLPHYISIAYAPVVILMVVKLKQSQFASAKWWVLALHTLFLLLPLLIIYGDLPIDDEYTYAMLSEAAGVFDAQYFALQCLLWGLLLFFVFSRKQHILLFAVFIASTSFFMYTYAGLQQGFVKTTGQELRNSNEEVWMRDHYNPSLSFYAQKTFLIDTDFVPGRTYFIRISRYDSKQMQILAARSGFVLVKVK
ncbi:glycosyltransferase family 39 protein [Marinilongibacter aquaticus]|uniref:ArnT family glycosyltransferase n=1 Tax=Marinilongibacter aquaticus TaxID=2975157 RepID=UPI0021BD2195|nr:glycosyltransferase family 39 protein [Marinilongibacter aquaticus]UBM58092.1 glycosyltransferase family 39 protein [Marinilongibacter aquaticus]